MVQKSRRDVSAEAAHENRFLILVRDFGPATADAVAHLRALRPEHVTPLYVGPDPAAPDAEQIKVEDDGKLSIPDPLKWLFEFDKAEKAGMAVRIPRQAITQKQASTTVSGTSVARS